MGLTTLDLILLLALDPRGTSFPISVWDPVAQITVPVEGIETSWTDGTIILHLPGSAILEPAPEPPVPVP